MNSNGIIFPDKLEREINIEKIELET